MAPKRVEFTPEEVTQLWSQIGSQSADQPLQLPGVAEAAERYESFASANNMSLQKTFDLAELEANYDAAHIEAQLKSMPSSSHTLFVDIVKVEHDALKTTGVRYSARNGPPLFIVDLDKYPKLVPGRTHCINLGYQMTVPPFVRVGKKMVPQPPAIIVMHASTPQAGLVPSLTARDTSDASILTLNVTVTDAYKASTRKGVDNRINIRFFVYESAPIEEVTKRTTYVGGGTGPLYKRKYLDSVQTVKVFKPKVNLSEISWQDGAFRFPVATGGHVSSTTNMCLFSRRREWMDEDLATLPKLCISPTSPDDDVKPFVFGRNACESNTHTVCFLGASMRIQQARDTRPLQPFELLCGAFRYIDGYEKVMKGAEKLAKFAPILEKMWSMIPADASDEDRKRLMERCDHTKIAALEPAVGAPRYEEWVSMYGSCMSKHIKWATECILAVPTPVLTDENTASIIKKNAAALCKEKKKTGKDGDADADANANANANDANANDAADADADANANADADADTVVVDIDMDTDTEATTAVATTTNGRKRGGGSKSNKAANNKENSIPTEAAAAANDGDAGNNDATPAKRRYLGTNDNRLNQEEEDEEEKQKSCLETVNGNDADLLEQHPQQQQQQDGVDAEEETPMDTTDADADDAAAVTDLPATSVEVATHQSADAARDDDELAVVTDAEQEHPVQATSPEQSTQEQSLTMPAVPPSPPKTPQPAVVAAEADTVSPTPFDAAADVADADTDVDADVDADVEAAAAVAAESDDDAQPPSQ